MVEFGRPDSLSCFWRAIYRVLWIFDLLICMGSQYAATQHTDDRQYSPASASDHLLCDLTAMVYKLLH